MVVGISLKLLSHTSIDSWDPGGVSINRWNADRFYDVRFLFGYLALYFSADRQGTMSHRIQGKSSFVALDLTSFVLWR